MEITTNITNNISLPKPEIFHLYNVAEAFNADFLDEDICREWILKAIHGRSGPRCPNCHGPILGIAVQRFWGGKRICCRDCGKFFTALTDTFLRGCHLTFGQIILLAMFLFLKIKRETIAEKVGISSETVRLWGKKFFTLSK